MLLAQAVGRATDLDDLDRVLSAWAERRKAISCLRFEARGTRLIPKDSEGEGMPPKDHQMPISLRMHFDVTRNWTRREWKGEIGIQGVLGFAPRFEVKVCDGKLTRSYEPREPNTSDQYKPSPAQPELWEITGYETFYDYSDYPFLLAMGVVPSPFIECKNLSRRIDASAFTFHGRGTVNRTECMIFRVSANDKPLLDYQEYWVTEKNASDLLRWVRYTGGKPFVHIDITNRQVGEGLWPHEWTCVVMNRDGKMRTSTTLSTTQLSINEPLAIGDVTIESKPGMTVYAKDNRIYRVQDDGASRVLVPLGTSVQQDASLGAAQGVFAIVLLVTLVCFVLVVRKFLLLRATARR
jgi:hypothetical protein